MVEAMDTVPIPNSTLPKVLIPKVTSSPPLDTLFNSKIVEKPTLELCALKYNWTEPSWSMVVWFPFHVKFLSLSALINFHATVPYFGEVASNPADNARYFIVSVGWLR